jgi:hypothetical protein
LQPRCSCKLAWIVADNVWHDMFRRTSGVRPKPETNSRFAELCSVWCAFSVIVKRRSIRTLFMAYAFWCKPRTRCLLQASGYANAYVATKVAMFAGVYWASLSARLTARCRNDLEASWSF